MTTSADPGEQPAPMKLADAIRVLAREQSAAEQYAVLLDSHGKADTNRYVQGITRYAEAKADFDGLIEALKTDFGPTPGSDGLAEIWRGAAFGGREADRVHEFRR